MQASKENLATIIILLHIPFSIIPLCVFLATALLFNPILATLVTLVEYFAVTFPLIHYIESKYTQRCEKSRRAPAEMLGEKPTP